MLTKDKAIKILMSRYDISRVEATSCWESDMQFLRDVSRDPISGKRIPGIKTAFSDERDYEHYLGLLEQDAGVNDTAYNYVVSGGKQ